MEQGLILQIDLVPRTSWYNNLRKVVAKEVWDRLRRQTYSEYSFTCGICGVKNVVLDCHEIWNYDDEKCIQKLVGLIALCKHCHQIKHYGLSQIQASKGELDLDKLHAHFMNVNNCSEELLKKHITEAFKQWRDRSRKQWTVDLGEFNQFLQSK